MIKVIFTILLSIVAYILGLFNGAEMERKRKWAEIFESRHGNTALEDLCNKIEVLYELSKKNT